MDNYGKKLYKLSINAGFTCPNRDGKIGTSGCIFCDGDGAGHFAGKYTDSINSQLKAQKELISNKLPKNKPYGFIAYFQAFTNTYAPVEILKEKYMEAVNDSDIEIISIATRPDCLSDEIIELLSQINTIKPVWVELGLQTIHKKTAAYIRRGYDLNVYDDAIRKLTNIGITQIITHLIIGLPGETKKDILDSVDYVVNAGTTGIKLQLLHVLKNTDLCNDYENGLFSTLTMDEYIDILKACIEHIPSTIVIHRLTGDGSKKNLVAPLWSADKKSVLNAINKALSV